MASIKSSTCRAVLAWAMDSIRSIGRVRLAGEVGEERHVDAAARDVRLHPAGRELGDLADHPADRHPRHAAFDGAFQAVAGEDPHLDERHLGQRGIERLGEPLAPAAGRQDDCFRLFAAATSIACKTDARQLAVLIGRTTPVVPRIESPPTIPIRAFKRLLRQRLAARDRDRDLDPGDRSAPSAISHRLGDHPPRHRVDRRRARRQLQARLGDRADALAAPIR